MNSLEDIYTAAKDMIELIWTAYSAGLREIEKEDFRDRYGNNYWKLEKDDLGTLAIISNKVIPLTMTDFGTLAKEFDSVYYVACKAAEFLKEKLDRFEADKQTLAPFILQEKIS